ncbi:hypothetical protein [Vibrio parahaemolyticus]|uniref:hypothetical protein n=1 Tax=Vibrio parahaemolyticus TaxID=670 RepID=UPI002360F911|nr:hypothetical protein [Vibrio parahaemolyticus]EHG1304053.1 hypothetical protein [Vibrio parahaemolyticus]
MKFKQIKDFNIKEMQLFVGKMEDVLLQLESFEIPDELGFTKTNLSKYCKSLVENQRVGLTRTKDDSWAVVEDDLEMPSDARVDFIFTPTYIAVATLSFVYLNYPEIANKINGYNDSLKKGMKFCTYRGLGGHGIERIEGMIEALVILSIGQVPRLLELKPDFCPELKQTFSDVEKELGSLLNLDEEYWCSSFSSRIQSAIETYYVMRDKNLLISLSNRNKAGK